MNHSTTQLFTQNPRDGEVHDPASAGTGSEGLRIANFSNCEYITDGVTSDVYRSGTSALKVICTGDRAMEPHNPKREIKILQDLRGDEHPNVIGLLGVHWDESSAFGRRCVLEFPFMPWTLTDIFAKGQKLDREVVTKIFSEILQGLKDIHEQGIIHRDIKPSAILLKSPSGPALLSDFGTAWHPKHSCNETALGYEPPDGKILDVGTGPYRAPECLFGNKSYTAAIDMWALGVMLSEAVTEPPTPIFESRPASEDGNQLGLILSIFKTMGTPTRESWPEAELFKVTPWDMYREFPAKPLDEVLQGVDKQWLELMAGLLRYSTRLTADEALATGPFQGKS